MIKSILSIAIAFLLSTQIFGQEAVNTIKLNYSQEEFKKAKESLNFTFEVSSEELGKKMVENTEKFYTQFFTLKQEGKIISVKIININEIRMLYRLLTIMNTTEVQFIDNKKIETSEFLTNYLL